jgi:hypothetical protein
MDWYRSNASAPYAVDKIDGDKVQLNGGVRYIPKDRWTRNDLYERFFVTFSPVFEETLATIDNPPQTRSRGATPYAGELGAAGLRSEHERSKRLRLRHRDVTQCNHEITWANGESFTFREMAARARAATRRCRKYVAAQRSLGWRSGLYTNYTDFAPVNAHWDTDA